jgi:hypothetical protein
MYLQLPKRGRDGSPRRFLEDLARIRNCRCATVSSWSRGWDWIARAEAYDTFVTFNPTAIAELEERRAFAAEIRAKGLEFRERAAAILEEKDTMTADDAIKLYKLGLDLEARAAKIEGPATESKRKELTDGITKLVDTLTTRVAGMAGGGPGVAIRATERTICFDAGEGDGGGGFSEVPALAGEIRE